MLKKNILLIEDEPSLAESIIFALKKEGFNSIWFTTGEESLDYLNENNSDLIIIDIGLPDINGFELIKIIRKNINIPIIILTARSEEIDKVIGLEIGADDYVTKPFSPRELISRIKAQIRRNTINNQKQNDFIELKNFNINEDKKNIFYLDKKLDLSKHEYLILKLLLSNPGFVFSREVIMDFAWEDNEYVLDRTVDSHIKSIRNKLREINNIDPIETHRGFGYSIKEKI